MYPHESLFTIHADSYMTPAMLDCHIVKEHQVHTDLTAEENEARRSQPSNAGPSSGRKSRTSFIYYVCLENLLRSWNTVLAAERALCRVGGQLTLEVLPSACGQRASAPYLPRHWTLRGHLSWLRVATPPGRGGEMLQLSTCSTSLSSL